MTPNEVAYYKFNEFIKEGKMILKTSEINAGNWQELYEGIMNVMRDGIETDFVQKNFITVDFGDGDIVNLSIFDLYVNIIFWYPIASQGQVIDGRHLHFPKTETQNTIKKFLDKYVIEVDRKIMDSVRLNNILDDTVHTFIESNEFSLYLANTINLKDIIDLMNACPEFDDIMHTKLPNTPIEEVKDIGMQQAERSIELILDSEKYIGYDHCMANSFRAEEGISPRQYKEYTTHIGSKPNGQGGVHAAIIDGSYIGGALNTVLSLFIDSNSSRVAQIQMKNNTGDSGGFARILGLNNIDSYLHHDHEYDCHTKNYEVITIKNEKILSLLLDRYYRLDPDGIEYRISENDTHLVGQTIYLRSPMTCASAARGNGVCYKCYGDLAYTNQYVKPGKYAAEKLSSELTQRQLSAKHLLETMIVKLKWFMNFTDYFAVNINVIQLAPDMETTKGFVLLIDPETIEQENEADYEKNDYFDGDIGASSDYNEYVRLCHIETPTGERIPIGTEDGDKMYLTNELKVYLNKFAKKTEEDLLEVDLHDIATEYEEFSLFLINLANDELSKTLNDIQDLINRKDTVASHDRNSVMQHMLDLIIEGRLHIMSIHMEMILMNQIRSVSNVLEKPDWDCPNEDYNLLTLDQALTDNPSITISLLYQNLSRVLYNPLSFKKTAPNPMDLFFVKQPQNFLSDTSNIVETKDKEDLFCPVVRYRVKDRE